MAEFTGPSLKSVQKEVDKFLREHGLERLIRQRKFVRGPKGQMLMYSRRQGRYLTFDEFYAHEREMAKKRLPRLRAIVGKITERVA